MQVDPSLHCLHMTERPFSHHTIYIRMQVSKRAPNSREPGLVIGCSPSTQEVEGSTPTGGTCPNDFSDPVDQDIRTQ